MENDNLQNYTNEKNHRITIDINVSDDSAFLSPYSQKDTPVISEDVASFLENSVASISHKEALSLRIHSDCIDDNEQIIYRKAIKNYYQNKFISTERELKKSFLIASILAFIGILTLTLAQIIGYSLNNPIWAEVIDIAAWVFLWEAVDIFIFRTRSLQLDKKRYLTFIDMNIEYNTKLKSNIA